MFEDGHGIHLIHCNKRSSNFFYESEESFTGEGGSGFSGDEADQACGNTDQNIVVSFSTLSSLQLGLGPAGKLGPV